MAARSREPQRGAPAVDLSPGSVLVFLGCFVALVAVTALFRSASRTTTALAIGSLLALALNPLVELVQRHTRLRRAASVALVFAGFALLVAVLAVVLVPPAVRQARSLGRELPEVTSQLGELPFVGDDLERNGVPDRVLQALQGLPDRLRGDLTPVRAAIGSLAAGISSGLIVLLVAVALLVDGPRLVGAARRLVPPVRRDTADRIATLAYRAIGRYVAGSLLVALIAALATLVAGLALGVPLTPLLAVNVMVFNLVPQIGGAAGGIPFVLMGLTQGAGTGVACAVFFLLYLQVENNLLSPYVIGQAVRLSPPATMSAALIGVAAGGVVGALLAVPLVGAAKLVYLELRPPLAGEADVLDVDRGRFTRRQRRRRADPEQNRGRRYGDPAPRRPTRRPTRRRR